MHLMHCVVFQKEAEENGDVEDVDEEEDVGEEEDEEEDVEGKWSGLSTTLCMMIDYPFHVDICTQWQCCLFAAKVLRQIAWGIVFLERPLSVRRHNYNNLNLSPSLSVSVGDEDDEDDDEVEGRAGKRAAEDDEDDDDDDEVI